MKKIRIIIAILLLPILMSHSVWMQISNKGSVGKPAKVHLYFGEIRHNLIEKGLKWYGGEMFKDYKAYVKNHNAKNSKSLSLVASETSLSATFTPEKVGIYQLVAFNETGVVRDLNKHGLGFLKDSSYVRTTFEATGRRQKQQGTIDLKPMMRYDIVPFPAKNGYGDYDSHMSTWRVNEKVYATFYINEKPASDKEVKVYSPDGWTTVVKTNVKGMFSFKPYTSGIYQAIYQKKRKVNGIYKGKSFNTTRVKVITNFNIK